MAYSFPLQRILDLKEREKEFLVRSLADSLQKKETAEKEYIETRHIQQRAEEHLSRIPEQGIQVKELLEQYRFIQQVAGKVKRAEEILSTLEKEVEREMEKVKGKEMEVKTYRRLRENGYREWLNEEEKKEQKALDEISIHSFLKKRENATQTG
ncbi:flagellar export protein FliJ [Thermicanus aegyptius]|uniref:flagellar export protein FliJ n=1 Tax=Thermicanus aegyptius TaxID=94009 RepID=UPI000347D213|nr:flagellar export protein FliJ [Thermicanus aegyptius]